MLLKNLFLFFFEDFNKEDLQIIDGKSDSPFIYIMNTKQLVVEKYSDAINYDGLKEDGWLIQKLILLDLSITTTIHPWCNLISLVLIKTTRPFLIAMLPIC